MPSVRRHGRNAQVYMGLTTGAVATPLPFQASWTLNKVVAKSDVTAFGDPNLVFVSALPDASGDFAGFMDAGTSQTYIAASDGLPRNFYLYWDALNDPHSYWYRTIFPDFVADGTVAGPVNFKATWNAAGPIQRYTAWGGMGT